MNVIKVLFFGVILSSCSPCQKETVQLDLVSSHIIGMVRHTSHSINGDRISVKKSREMRKIIMQEGGLK